MVKIGMLIADRYEVLEKIGTGGMSVVYRAKDHKLNRFVAIKVLKQEFSDNASFVSKFRVEAQAAAGLMHPNIVNVYDVGEEKGINYIVMELVDGITLKKYIEKKSRLSVKEAISIAIQVSMGLQAAHHARIIHRDIKPQNIIISKDGKVKITDFGIAKAATSNTITSNVMGSVHYTSPEQARGGYSDERSDIYSLGITIFEMLTGRVPFNGETTVAIAIKHIQSPMPSPREFVPEIPVSVEQIVLKCCEKSPDRRYQNMESLIADLKQSLIHPDDNFVKVIHPDEESATRISSPIEHSKVRQGMYESERREPVREDRYPEEDAYEDHYSQRRRSASGRLDAPLRKNRDLRKSYEADDYADDFDDDGYDPGRERRITAVSIAAAVAIGIIIIAVAAVKLGLFSPSGLTGESTAVSTDGLVKMPAVAGKNVDEVQKELTSLGLKPDITYEESDKYDSGIVISSDVDEGTGVAQGTKIALKVSAGKNGITVPDVTGKTVAEAVSILEQKGFTVSRKEAQSDTAAKNTVISQSPTGTAQSGATITITVSSGAQEAGSITVPDVRGKTKDDATAALVAAGFSAANITVNEVEVKDPNLTGVVSDQSPAADSEADAEDKITLSIGKSTVKTYSYTAEITAPTEGAGYVDGTPVYCVLIAGDGTKLLDGQITQFPYPVSYTGLSSGTGTLKMSYKPAGTSTDANGNPVTGEAVVTRELTFTPED